MFVLYVGNSTTWSVFTSRHIIFVGDGRLMLELADSSKRMFKLVQDRSKGKQKPISEERTD